MIITFLIAKIILGGYWLTLAPVLFLPLGTVLLSSQARRGIFGYLAILLAVVFAAFGVSLICTLPLPDAVTVLAGILAIWCLAGAITHLARSMNKKLAASVKTRRCSAPTSALISDFQDLKHTGNKYETKNICEPARSNDL